MLRRASQTVDVVLVHAQLDLLEYGDEIHSIGVDEAGESIDVCADLAVTRYPD